jgi:hypothetical protein
MELSCISLELTQSFSFAPTGFSTPVMKDGFNLTP